MKKSKVILIYLIGFISAISLTVIASLLYKAEDVLFTPNNEEWNVSNVGEAINDIEENYVPRNEIVGKVWDFNFKEDAHEYKVPTSGTYKLEVWGAQGGSDYGIPGYGGYSTGTINLKKNSILFIYVANKPSVSKNSINGGGDALLYSQYNWNLSPGGGATHIAFVDGELRDIEEDDRNQVIIVAGGGAGGAKYTTYAFEGGSGGGYIGTSGSYRSSPGSYTVYNMASGGEQTQGGINAVFKGRTASFGQGAAAAGSGYYGGGSGDGYDCVVYSSGGGSGFINHKDLNNGIMYCYNCSESDNLEYRTVSTTGSKSEVDKTNCPSGYSSSPISKCAKAGDGHARITLISFD